MKHFTPLRSWFLFTVATALLNAEAHAQQSQYSHGDPTGLEQQMLELVNRARQNPTQEGVILDLLDTAYSRDARARKPSFFANLRGEFATYSAVPPLAFHPKLIQAARTHSQDMVTRGYFSHTNPEGQDPGARAAAAGYDSGVGENIEGGGASTGAEVMHSHFGFMVDYDNVDLAHPLGHRLNVLSSSYSEIGVGIAGSRNAGRITQDFGIAGRVCILGVAYSDANQNGRYDAGEGMSGITVRPDFGNWFAITSSSGGFAMPIEPVQTASDSVSLPFPVQTSTWANVKPYDEAYRQQQLVATPNLTVNLTWSGGALAATTTTSVNIKRPVLRNYRLTGTDGWYYTLSMVTTVNAKADLAVSSGTAASAAAPTWSYYYDLAAFYFNYYFAYGYYSYAYAYQAIFTGYGEYYRYAAEGNLALAYFHYYNGLAGYYYWFYSASSPQSAVHYYYSQLALAYYYYFAYSGDAAAGLYYYTYFIGL